MKKKRPDESRRKSLAGLCAYCLIAREGATPRAKTFTNPGSAYPGNLVVGDSARSWRLNGPGLVSVASRETFRESSSCGMQSPRERCQRAKRQASTAADTDRKGERN